MSLRNRLFHSIYFSSLLRFADRPALLISAAPCRMRTKLPQALCIQHPKQLQRGSQTSSVHHLPQQQPVPAPLHHWVNIQCRDRFHLRGGRQPHPLTHPDGTGELTHTILTLCSQYSFKLGSPMDNIYATTSNKFVLSLCCKFCKST